ncbi:MAG: FHA domain-containing protein, partial [Myxococcota bacterium]
MFTVTVSEKDGQQSTFNFDKPEIGIGRVKGNDIVLPKGNVSKRHSRIVVKDGKFIVIDLKSTNGTYVNGRKITSPQVIKSADKVYIGDFVLTVTGDPNSVGQNAPPPAVAPPGIQEMKPRPPSGLTPPPPAPLTPPPPQAAPIAPPPPQAAPITPPSPPLTPPPPARPSPSSSGALTPPPPAGLGNPTLQATPAISQPKRPTNSGLGRVSSSNLGATPPRPGGLGSSNGLSASSPSRPATPPRPQRPTGPSRPLTPPPPSSNTAPQPPSAPAPPTPVPAPPPVAPPDVAPARPIGQEMLSSLRTPGAGVIPPEPQFVSRFDQNLGVGKVLI